MRLSRLLFLVPAATALLYACDDHDDDHEPTSDIGDVVLEGTVTDETFVALQSALDQGPPVTDVAQGGSLDAPADGAELPRTPAALFSWHFGATAARPAAPAGARLAASEPPSPSPWALSPVPERPAGFAAFAAPLRELLGPMRSAHAHGTPYTGTATYLRFSIDSNPKLVEVFTSNTSYTPAPELWSKLTGAGKPITLSLVSAIFEENRVAQDGGPFAGSTVTFTIAP
jgi:hypothetical protein